MEREVEVFIELDGDSLLVGRLWSRSNKGREIQRSGARVRITAQLIHAPTERNLWASTYDRDVRDILMMQAEVAGEVAP